MIVNNELSVALDTFLEVFSDWTLGDLGPHMTCREADALANLLTAAGRPDLAQALLDGHAFEGDILDSGVCHQACFRVPAGNTLALHHRYAPGPLPAAND